ncbi:hypothetical protein JHW43_000826 [Diplocarpon mali]|nr:hypothetical protein JHW43_000826 [Diplocarpon mali]
MERQIHPDPDLVLVLVLDLDLGRCEKKSGGPLAWHADRGEQKEPESCMRRTAHQSVWTDSIALQPAPSLGSPVVFYKGSKLRAPVSSGRYLLSPNIMADAIGTAVPASQGSLVSKARQAKEALATHRFRDSCTPRGLVEDVYREVHECTAAKSSSHQPIKSSSSLGNSRAPALIEYQSRAQLPPQQGGRARVGTPNVCGRSFVSEEARPLVLLADLDETGPGYLPQLPADHDETGPGYWATATLRSSVPEHRENRPSGDRPADCGDPLHPPRSSPSVATHPRPGCTLDIEPPGSPATRPCPILSTQTGRGETSVARSESRAWELRSRKRRPRSFGWFSPLLSSPRFYPPLLSSILSSQALRIVQQIPPRGGEDQALVQFGENPRQTCPDVKTDIRMGKMEMRRHGEEIHIVAGRTALRLDEEVCSDEHRSSCRRRSAGGSVCAQDDRTPAPAEKGSILMPLCSSSARTVNTPRWKGNISRLPREKPGLAHDNTVRSQVVRVQSPTSDQYPRSDPNPSPSPSLHRHTSWRATQLEEQCRSRRLASIPARATWLPRPPFGTARFSTLESAGSETRAEIDGRGMHLGRKPEPSNTYRCEEPVRGTGLVRVTSHPQLTLGSHASFAREPCTCTVTTRDPAPPVGPWPDEHRQDRSGSRWRTRKNKNQCTGTSRSTG